MPLPSITLTTPLVLTAHSLCPTTAHGVTNDAMQTPMVLQPTHHSSSSLSTLNTLIQPITLAIFLVVHWPYPCHSVHHQWLGKRGVVHAMCCHSTPFTLVHPFALLTLFVIGSHSVSNPFTSERVTVHTHICQERDSVDDTLQTRHTG